MNSVAFAIKYMALISELRDTHTAEEMKEIEDVVSTKMKLCKMIGVPIGETRRQIIKTLEKRL